MNASLPFTGSPTAAYRADMNGRGAPFGPKDALWLAAASELHLAATARTQIPQRQHLLEALSLAIDIVGDEKIDRYVTREWFGRHAFHEALFLLASDVLDAGAHRLASVMLEDMIAAVPRLKALDRGRLMALRARVEWRTSNLDEARDRYNAVAELGHKSGEKELEARAAVGLATVAQRRGNMPALHDLSLQIIELASAIEHPYLERWGHMSMVMFAGKTGDYLTAINSGWRVVELSRDALEESEGLGNLGQVLLVAGDAALARSCFAVLAARELPMTIMLPALGGLARSSAALGAEPTVEWASREVWRARDLAVPRYELSEALLESALALRELARHDEAERYRAAAHAVAQAGGFHELEFRAARLETEKRTTNVSPEAYPAVVSGVRRMEPERLPTRVAFEAAPA